MRKLISLNNYKILFLFRILKSILALFTENFLVLYFLQLSCSNILPLGIYNLISVMVLYFTIFLLRNRCKAKNRILLLRIGIILDLIYFLMIILLKEKLIKYIYLVGIVYGLEEGFYFSVYNILESDGIDNNDRAKFNGNYKAISNIVGIIFPLIFGGMIAATNFSKSVILVLMIIIMRMILSFKLKDTNIPKENATDLKSYFKLIKQHKSLKYVHRINIVSGLTYSAGAFLSIITVYIIKVCKSSVSLGMFTSIVTLLVAFVAYMYAHGIKSKSYIKIIITTSVLTILSLMLMIFKCNMVTIIVFNLCSKINWEFIYLINSTSQNNLSNLKDIRKKYKVEFYQTMELFLFIGRFISYILFILMAFVPANTVLPIFILFLILLMINSIKLQKESRKEL